MSGDGGSGAARLHPNGRLGLPDVDQQASPMFVLQDEREIDQRVALRLIAFVRGELEWLPRWHPQHHEYRIQLERLERRCLVGPRLIV